jgi:hypothetical protein
MKNTMKHKKLIKFIDKLISSLASNNYEKSDITLKTFFNNKETIIGAITKLINLRSKIYEVDIEENTIAEELNNNLTDSDLNILKEYYKNYAINKTQ